jgi:outer membrane DcaP-like protein
MRNLNLKAISVFILLIMTMRNNITAQDVKELREEIQRQKTALEKQRKALEDQAKRLDELMLRLSSLEAGQTRQTKVMTVQAIHPARPENISTDKISTAIDPSGVSPPNPPQQILPGSKTTPQGELEDYRDPIGDLNTDTLQKGEFPGSFVVGESQRISLGFTGFVKPIGFYDTNFENGSLTLDPNQLGVGRLDERGEFRMDATLSRFGIDGRASVPGGKLRGYIEFDFTGASNINLRHAYLAYDTPKSQFLAGQTWSNFMDIRAIPQTVSGTVSGLNSLRQAQVSWSQNFGKGFHYAVAVEDPVSSDIELTDEANFARAHIPDVVGQFGYLREGVAHVQVAGLVRRHEVFNVNGTSDSATGWGVNLTGTVGSIGEDSIIFGTAYGEGMARYMVGLDPFAGGYVDAQNRLRLRKTYGAYGAYQRIWTEKLRMNIYGGFAQAVPGLDQPAGTFKTSMLVSGNFLYHIMPYLTFGLEYTYAKRTNLSAPSINNNRILFGFQLF